MKFASTQIQACSGVSIAYFQYQHPFLLLPLFIKEYLKPQIRTIKLVNQQSGLPT